LPDKWEKQIAEALPPGAARMDERVAILWGVKIVVALGAGVDVRHCGSHDCGRTPDAAAGCERKCVACAHRASLLAEATRGVHHTGN
jgi:hypothetical protein